MRLTGKLTLARTMLLAATSLAASGCAQVAPVNRPCGVIEDSLVDVEGKTPGGDQRISSNFERGVRAGCWNRQGQLLK